MKLHLNSLRSSAFRFGSAAVLALSLLCLVPGQASAQVGVSVNVFYDSLAPYGEWLYVGQYGRVWRPRASLVGIGFRPYATGGHWVYTDYGWSFESDYEWGWAPFHYGRWLLDPAVGWVWVPDTVWAPAWVDWRYGDGYIGWAPLAPIGARVVIDSYSPAWCFVSSRHFLERDFYHYAEPIDRVRFHFGTTVQIRNEVAYGRARWYAGPPVSHIASAVGQPIHPVAITPPRAGVVQQVHAGRPTIVSAPTPASRGVPVTPNTSTNVTRAAPHGVSNAHPVAPGWTQGRPINPQPASPGASTKVPPAPAVPRQHPGGGAQPEPSAVPSGGRVATPQSAAPQSRYTAPGAQFMRPVPQPAPTFVHPAPVARAAQMPMSGRSIQASQSSPSARYSAPSFHAPIAPAPQAPVAIAPTYRAAQPTVAYGVARGGGGPPRSGSPVGRVKSR
jgi:hypothetical protein